MNNDNAGPLEDLEIEMKRTATGLPRCEICGTVGDVAVTRLAGGDLAVMAACALHWPPGAITPEAWVEQERARGAARLSRLELLAWLLSGSPSETLQ